MLSSLKIKELHPLLNIVYKNNHLLCFVDNDIINLLIDTIFNIRKSSMDSDSNYNLSCGLTFRDTIRSFVSSLKFLNKERWSILTYLHVS